MSSQGRPGKPMRWLGIEWRKPSFNELTAATVMAVGLWVAVLGLAHACGQDLAPDDAGALLLVSAWGCISARMGLALGAGRRHVAAHIGGSALLLTLYHAALAIAS